MIDFLNALLPQHEQIVDLAFKNTEQLGQTEFDYYQPSLKIFRDNKAVFYDAQYTAYDEGKLDCKLAT